MSTPTSGKVISASFFNSIQSRVALLLGNGGYYVTPTSTQIPAGGVVTSSAWAKLQADINKIRQHQAGTAYNNSELPTIASNVASKGSIVDPYYNNMATLETNKFIAAVSNMTLTSSASTVTRATTWGSSATASIITEVQADWGTTNNMEQFFNTGGEIRWTMAHPSTSTPQNTAWNTLLSSLGPFDVHGGSSTTSTSTSVKRALSDITTTYTQIFTKASTTTSYTANTVTIDLKKNAANTGIVLRITFNDAHTNVYSDTVASGTNVVFSHLKSTVVITGVTSPTFTVIDPL